MLAHRLRFRASICPALFRRLVFAGIPIYMGHCMGYSVATLPQQIPANTIHWPNAATEMTHSLQRWPSICLELDHCLVFFWNDSGVRFYTLPSGHGALVWHLRNACPTSKTLGRRCINVVRVFCIHWVYNNSI